MKLSTKLATSLSSMGIGIVALGIFCVLEMDKMNVLSSDIADNWLPSTVQVLRMDTLVTVFRMYESNRINATAQTLKDEYDKRIVEVEATLKETSEKYQTLIVSPAEQNLYAKFEKLWKEYMEVHATLARLTNEDKRPEASALLVGPSRQLFHRISATLMESVEYNIQGGNAARDQAASLFSSARMLVLVALGLLLTLVTGVGVYIVRDTMRTLGKDPAELGALARQVAGGELNISKDFRAIGVYADILAMVENLKKNIETAELESSKAREQSDMAQQASKQAEKASHEAAGKTRLMLNAADKLEEVGSLVSSALTQLSAQIEQSEKGASEQASRVTETATAMEEMNSTVLEVARNASAASDVSASTRKEAEAGASIVAHAVKSIQTVQKQALTLKDDMVILSGQAQSISQIMSVISDIADQTNLLALNAAIEAARAGEAGRGFAVVADEVRKLAEKTMASTSDVGNAIRTIQQSTVKSMEQVDRSVEAVEEATKFASQSGEALQKIVRMVDNAADQVQAIATAAEEQSASSEEISQSISQVNIIAGETARAMQEASQAVMELAKQSTVLTGLIEDMKAG